MARDRGDKRVDVDRYPELAENLQDQPLEAGQPSAMTGPAADGEARGVVMWSRARAVMGAFRPAVWLVLQDVALDAAWRDGRLVSATSARLVAEHLRIDPSTAASALRTLRDRGIVELSQAAGPNGRFGLATYTLHLPDGVDVLGLCTELSYTENPHTVTDAVTAHRDEDLVFSCPSDGAAVPSPERESSDTVELPAVNAQRGAAASSGPLPGFALSAVQPDMAPTGVSCDGDLQIGQSVSARQRIRRPPGSPPAAVEQGAFDLGPGTQ